MSAKDVSTPQPTRRDKELARDLLKMVADSTTRHLRDSGLSVVDEKTLQHRSGATVKAVSSMDGWSNLLTGQGTRADKRMHNEPHWDISLTEMQAEDLYASDRNARRMVDLMPHEATREGIEWLDPKKSKFVADEHERLNVMMCLRDASVFGRLYGGGAIMLNDGVTPVERLMEPWTDGAQVQSLVVLSRWELWAYATQLQRDITKPDFGKPLRYRLFPRMTFGQTAMEIHASRLIRFDGLMLPRLKFIQNNFWHDSVLTSMKESLGDYKSSIASVATTLHDFRMLVHKIQGLTDMLNAGKESVVRQKLEIMNMARSVLGAWVIDGEDDSQFHSASLAGVADLANLVKERLQSEADAPGTIFFNESPAGRLGGSDGNHEERTWYNTVHAWQISYLDPRLKQLNRVLLAQNGSPGGTTEDHAYAFKSLWQQDDLADAKTNQANAAADQVYMQSGVRTPAQVQAERFPDEAKETPASEEFIKQMDPGAGENLDPENEGEDDPKP